MRLVVDIDDADAKEQLDRIAILVAPLGASPKRTAALRAVIAIGLETIASDPTTLTRRGPPKKTLRRGVVPPTG